MITADLLRKLKPSLTPQQAQTAAAALQQAAVRFDITTPERVRHFAAQVGHESGFLPQEEGLSYSAQRLAEVWPNRYAVNPRAAKKTPNALALRLHHNPQAIANHTYADRMGNGGPESGDGYRYRGRGYIQNTGRAGYAAAGAGLGINLVQEPDLLLQPTYAAMAAGWFWQSHGLNALADKGDLEGITLKINGGTNGIDDRRRLYALAKAFPLTQQAADPYGVVLLVPLNGGDPVRWNGRDPYAGQSLRELVPQLRTLYPTAGGPWQYGGVLTVWVRRNGEMVLERLPQPAKGEEVPALPPKK